MKDIKAKAPLKHENSKSVVEAAIDLSRGTKEGTWEDVVRKSAQQKPYSKTAPSRTSRPSSHRKIADCPI
jgi:hypothetical protein